VQLQERIQSPVGLDAVGIHNPGNVYWNLSIPALYEEAIQRHEGVVAANGPFVTHTGQHTGRSANDKFVVDEPSSTDKIWWGPVNKSLPEDKFRALHDRMMAYAVGKDLFVQDLYAGADPTYRLPIRIITGQAWHSMFARSLFIEPPPSELASHRPEFTVIYLPTFTARPAEDGTRSETFIALNFGARQVLIGGTSYAGEMKKSIFTVLNYLLPLQGVLSMHCSANVGADGQVAIFFGLSGTGKTTLSADPERTLIGDDEHGWSDRGIFNFEGGCYAKVIRLSPTAEPEIYATTRRFGTILENVVYDPVTRELDLDDDSLTENTRGAYPLSYIPNASATGLADHPSHIVLLTADAYGVLPPIAKLTTEQTMYQFLSGYTARVAGTEKGVVEPQATFSTCFGAPFLPLHPNTYARLLGQKINERRVTCWLVNTGWTGGPYGVGSRMKIGYTRAMIRAALSGRLAEVPTEEDPIFGLHIPTACPDVPSEVLNPRNTWSDKNAYDEQARKLAGMFKENFAKYADQVAPEVRAAGPKV